MTIFSWLLIIVGALLIIFAAVFSRRKGEAEISESLTSKNEFRIGVICTVIGVIIKIVQMFL